MVFVMICPVSGVEFGLLGEKRSPPFCQGCSEALLLPTHGEPDECFLYVFLPWWTLGHTPGLAASLARSSGRALLDQLEHAGSSAQ